MRTPLLRAAPWLLALVALTGCTGTFTPTVPTLYLVFVEAPSEAPRVAVIAFRSDQTGRSVVLLERAAATFPSGTTLLAADVLDREERTEVWLLSAEQTSPRATTLHRFDLQGIRDDTGVSVRSLGTTALTGADGRWLAPFSPASAVPSGCLTDLVVRDNGAEVLLVDSGSGNRCGAFSEGVDARVHRLQFTPAEVTERVAFPLPPGVRPGVETGEVLIIARPTVGAEVEVRREGFAPTNDSPSALLANLRDVRATRDGFAALVSSSADERRIALVSLPEESRSERDALARAERLWLREDSRGATLISVASNTLGIDYPGQEVLRRVNFAALDLTIDANAYALAVGPAGGCFLDLLVASDNRSCDINLPSDVNNELRFARFAAWTYAAVQNP